MNRNHLLGISLAGLASSTAALFWHPNPLLSYIAMAFLALSAITYLIPEKEREKCLTFPREHNFYQFLRKTNLLSVPLTFAFVYAGLEAATSSLYWVVMLLAVMRIGPSLILNRIIHLRRREVLDAPIEESFAGIDERPLCKAAGYVYETRTRQRRRFGNTLYNVWLIDGSPVKLFLPAMSETKNITEPVREGAKVFVVGPSTRRFGITALQPIVSVVVPPDWMGGETKWFDVIWKRSWKRRLVTVLTGSIVYSVAILVLAWAVSDLSTYAGRLPSLVSISLLSAIFFGFLAEKSARESAIYEVGGYFEPKRHTLSPEKLQQRFDHLKRLVESGLISEDYLNLLEKVERKP